MEYMTTLIIPFGFDCDMGDIGRIEAMIEKQKIWQRQKYDSDSVYRHIAKLYDAENSSRTAAFYTASGQVIQDKFAGTRKFCIKTRDRQYEYIYSDLQLYVFETGVGFLCLELNFRDLHIMKYLRSVVRSGSAHMCCTGRDSYDREFPMIEIIRRLLGFNPENDIFFTMMRPEKFAQALTFSYADVPDVGVNDVMSALIHISDDSEYGSQSENFGEEYMSPYQGISWGISSRSIAIVRSEKSAMPASNVKGDYFNQYLPLIILAYHQKYAMIKFSAMVNGSSAQIADARNDMIDFRVRSSFVSVSDTQIFQQLYDKIMSVNHINEMIKENDRKLESLLQRENNAHRVRLEKITGIITIIFTVMGITSILTDGLTAADSLLPEAVLPFAKILLLAASAGLAALGIYGIITVKKHTR